jgi:glutathione S-transferase
VRDAGYTLYGRTNSGSLAIQIVLEELRVPYQLVWVGRSAEDVAQYCRINPAGKVPALALPDGATVFESAAILLHLTGTHPAARLAPPIGSSAHARFLQWIVFLSANVYEAVLRYYYPERYSTAGGAAAEDIKAQALLDFRRQIELVHDRLDPYLGGPDFTAADPYLYMLASWYPDGVTALERQLPKLGRHAALVRERPATRKSEDAHTER